MAAPHVLEQREMVRTVMSRPLCPDDDMYIVSTSWFGRWKMAVGYDSGVPMSYVIGAIDNSGIIKCDGCLTPNLKRVGVDYELVTGLVWRRLRSWFGGGPEMRVGMYLCGCSYRGPSCLNTWEISYRGIWRDVIVDDLMSDNDFKCRFRWVFNIPSCEQVRVIDVTGGTGNGSRVLEKIEFDMLGSKRLVLDFMGSAGVWDSEFSEKNLPLRFGSAMKEDIGLRNLGNSCYFNSGVQCLLHTRPLIDFLSSGQLSFNVDEKGKGRLTRAFGKLICEFIRTESTWISPDELRKVIGELSPQFANNAQQDAHELVMAMLDRIHQDLNIGIGGHANGRVCGDGTDDPVVAEKAWHQYREQNNSAIVDMFCGQLRSELNCTKCAEKTVLFEPYMCLCLPIRKTICYEFSVIFIPYDLNRKCERLLFKASNETELNAHISKLVGRQVNVAIVYCTASCTNVSYVIGVQKEDESVCFAVEIPDVNKRYILGRIRNSSDDLTSLIAVEVDDYTVDFPGLSRLFEARLAQILWNRESVSHDGDITHMKERLIYNACSTIIWTEHERISVKQRESYGFMPVIKTDAEIRASEQYPFLASDVVHVFVNPDHVDNSCAAGILELSAGLTMIKERKVVRNRRVSLAKCIDYFTAPEVLDDANRWRCPKCHDYVCAQKKVDIWTCPTILVIQLRRFTGDRTITAAKISDDVDFPDVLDMAPLICPSQKDKNLIYNLYAVSEHSGGLEGGHYTAHSFLDKDKEWFFFNDSNVSPARLSDVHTNSAYILFYERARS